VVSTLTVVTDQFGNAHVVLLATVEAPTQPAFLRATDLTTGEQQTAQFTIVQTINGSTVLSVVPSTVNITGPDTSTCSQGIRTDYYIYGGTPPYTVQASFPNLIDLLNTTVAAPGLSFSAITNGGCVNPLVFTIRDSTGLQTTATLTNVPGTTKPVPPVTPLNAAPGKQTVACTGQTIAELITGGTAPYGISPSVNGVVVTPSSLAAQGYVQISNMTKAFPGPTYSFLVTDSSTPQQTFTFTIICSS
jgi:hypothetical protein